MENDCSFDFLLTHIYQLLKFEVWYEETEDQDLCRSFFRNWFEFLEAEIYRFFMLQLSWNTLYIFFFPELWKLVERKKLLLCSHVSYQCKG